MKKIIFLIITFYSIYGISQPISAPSSNPPPSNIVNVCNDQWGDEVPNYTYFKDINNTFEKFTGTWKYIKNNHVVIFEITKVTQKYNPEYKVYEDYLIGNYSYSIDGGNSYVVNTITTPINDDSENNPMYSSCTEGNKIPFIFTDVVLNKKSCWIYFEFLQGSTTQMKVKIKNEEEVIGEIQGDPPKNPAFTLPVIMTVTKQ
ncbi:DUF6705 family protein [Kordia sp.]|uniref:DUF6705 family protein n=1 Tax=Kordia sp. TaxID=1965332 RepID=UPI003D287552